MFVSAGAPAPASKRCMVKRSPGLGSLTVAVMLCGGAAMLALRSPPAVPSRTGDDGVSRGRRASAVRSFENLQVNLGLEKRLHESPGQLSRDPFRFSVRPAQLTPRIRQAETVPSIAFPPAPPETLPGAPMPWELMAIVQRDTTRWAVFSDCRGIPVPIPKGGSLAGQWRVMTIGVESVTLQALDDRRIDLPLRGCPPR